MATAANDGGAGDEGDRRPRGVLFGRDINLRPDPPPKDLLNSPLEVSRLPEIDLRCKTLVERVSAFVLGTVLGYRESEHRALWELRQTTAAVMACVSPSAARELEAEGWALRRNSDKGGQRVVRVTHPDQLQDAFSTLIAASGTHTEDRQDLEMLLAMVLRTYINEMSSMMGTTFSFDTEGHSHCLHAYEQERQLKNVVDQYERMAVLQQICNAYSYTANYYLYSLIAREKPEQDHKMFSMYVRAVFFLSRLQYDGTLQEHVNRRRLPLRRDVMFRLKRDQNLQRRYAKDPDFAAQIKNIIGFFPVV